MRLLVASRSDEAVLDSSPAMQIKGWPSTISLVIPSRFSKWGMSLRLTMTGGLVSTADACRFTVMNKTHRAEIAKNAKRYLDDMFGSPFLFPGLNLDLQVMRQIGRASWRETGSNS